MPRKSKVKYDPQGEVLYISHPDWDFMATASLRPDYADEIQSVSWSKNGDYLYSSTFECYLHVYIMKKWYGEDFYDTMKANDYVVDHMDNDIKGKAYIETPKKYYFSDLGLRNARINFRQFEQTHSMENVIYNELRMRGYSVDVGVIPIAERDQEGKVIRKQLEVDFVCNLGSSRYYIQSAYSLPDEAKRTQEIRPFRKIDDSFKKIVVTKDIVQPHYDEYGILTVNIYDFLLDPQILEK